MLKRTMLLSAGALLGLSSATAAQDISSIEITSEQVADNIWMLRGAGGNMGLHAGEDAVFLIDDQFAPLTDKILAEVQRLTGRGVDFVLNTHYHGDHTGGNENLGDAGALIFGHENVRTRIIEDNGAPGNAPVVTFSDRQSFHINGEDVRAYHVHHAHTDGDAFVYFENANVLHTGDLVFEIAIGSFPFIDLNGGGSVPGAIAAIDSMLKLADADTVVVPGHGNVMDREGLVAYRLMLTTIRDNVQALIDEGKTKEEAVAAKPAEAYRTGRVGGFISEDVFVATVYDSLTAE